MATEAAGQRLLVVVVDRRILVIDGLRLGQLQVVVGHMPLNGGHYVSVLVQMSMLAFAFQDCWLVLFFFLFFF